jgi:hypothetical protein
MMHRQIRHQPPPRRNTDPLVYRRKQRLNDVAAAVNARVKLLTTRSLPRSLFPSRARPAQLFFRRRSYMRNCAWLRSGLADRALIGLKYQVESLGGLLTVQTAPGAGTTVQ